MSRAKRTGIGAGAGALAGLIAGKAIEHATGIDVLDGALEIGGLIFGVAIANPDVTKLAFKKLNTHLGGRSLGSLSTNEWKDLARKYPNAIRTLDKALRA